MTRIAKGFVITNKGTTQVVGCGTDYYASDFIRHACIFPTYEAALALTKAGPPTTEYWGDKKMARLMRTAVIKPATITI
jgi:hypothetical protein